MADDLDVAQGVQEPVPESAASPPPVSTEVGPPVPSKRASGSGGSGVCAQTSGRVLSTR